MHRKLKSHFDSFCENRRHKEYVAGRFLEVNALSGCAQATLASSYSAMSVIESTPEIMGGTPVFKGTRVPARTLFDYLEGGDSIEEFMEDFPTVRREQVMEALTSMLR
jgi:uncharacterized protein (DUF433 family)